MVYSKAREWKDEACWLKEQRKRNLRKREIMEREIKGSATQPQNKSKSKIREVRKGKSLLANGRWNNVRKAG